MPQEEEEFIRAPPFRRYSTTMNNSYFESHTQRGYSRRPSETQRRSYNRFESLSTEVECYKCNNFGHMAKNCRMTVPPKEPQ
jgi:hypothetical protein